jgi:hypothetical protein
MRLFLLLLTLSFLIVFKTSAQNNIEIWSIKRTKKDGRDSTKELIRTDDSGYFKLKKLPQIIDIVFRDFIEPSGSILFNKGSDQATLSFKDGSTHKIHITDLKNATLRLQFIDNKLISIGNRVLEDPLQITGKIPSIGYRIEQKTKDTTKNIVQTPFQKLSSIKGGNCFINIDDLDLPNLFICTTVECCNDKKQKSEISFINYLNEHYLSDGAPSYRIIVNAIDGTTKFIKYKKSGKTYELIDDPLLKVNSKILVSVIGPADTSYIIDSSYTSLYLSADTSFLKSLAGLGTTINSQSSGQTDPNPGSEKNNPLQIIVMGGADNPNKQLLDELKYDLQSLKTDKLLSKATYKIIYSSITGIEREVDSLYKIIDILTIKNIALDSTIENFKAKLESLKNPDLISALTREKILLMDLLKSLEQFNLIYRDINFKETQYLNALLCLKMKIERHFSIPVNFNSEDLANQLSFRILNSYNTKDAEWHYPELSAIVEKIAEQYKVAVGKKATQSIYSRSVFVKNEDLVKISIKRNDGKSIFQHDFNTKGGFKLDVSTGLFVTGLRDKNYSFIDSTVWYRRDSSGFTPSSGNIYDTTGRIVIQEQDSRSRIGVGVLLHAYPRLSRYVNVGLAAGFLTTANIDLNLMAGFSLMLGNGRRIVLSGGCIWGKVNRLSTAYKTGVNRYTGNVLRPEDERYAKPIFYSTPGGAVPTTSIWSKSYFFGVSWNLTAK